RNLRGSGGKCLARHVGRRSRATASPAGPGIKGRTRIAARLADRAGVGCEWKGAGGVWTKRIICGRGWTFRKIWGWRLVKSGRFHLITLCFAEGGSLGRNDGRRPVRFSQWTPSSFHHGGRPG